MKKLYFIITVMFITLLASCSQEEQMNQETDRVSISAKLPTDIAATRAQIAVPTTHKLRCIIEVWTKSANPTLKYRKEVAVEGGAIPTFDFGLRPGDYTCLMWADFIKKDASSTEVTTGGEVTYTHFEDTYYDTSDLHQITIKDKYAVNLFDTDLCDGFYAGLEVKKNATTVQQTVKMTRPFAKLTIKENDAEKFATLTGLEVSYEMPKVFNVATGEPGAEMLTSVYEKVVNGQDESQVLFSGYVFTPSAGISLGSALLTFKMTKGEKTREIPGESIMLKRNEQITAAGSLIGGGALKPTDPEEPTADPEVGDYFFIDGTWSNELTEANKANCVGIVYAVGTQPGDDISNYPNSDGKSIKGYVMALQNIEVKDFLPTVDAANYAMSGRPYFYKQNSGNYDVDVVNASKEAFKALTADWDVHNGFFATTKILATEVYTQNKLMFYHPALALFEKWRETAVKIDNASEWYIPSAAQLLQFSGGLFGFVGGSAGSVVVPAVTKNQTYNDAFMAAIEQGIMKHFPANNSNKGYYIYSLSFSSDPVPHALQIGYGEGGAGSIIAAKPNFKIQGDIRPVLTIIK